MYTLSKLLHLLQETIPKAGVGSLVQCYLMYYQTEGHSLSDLFLASLNECASSSEVPQESFADIFKNRHLSDLTPEDCLSAIDKVKEVASQIDYLADKLGRRVTKVELVSRTFAFQLKPADIGSSVEDFVKQCLLEVEGVKAAEYLGRVRFGRGYTEKFSVTTYLAKEDLIEELNDFLRSKEDLSPLPR